MDITEKLRHLECCLKCKKVDVEFEIHKINIPSQTGNREKLVKKCVECSDHVYSYEGTKAMASKELMIKVSIILCIFVTLVGYFEGIKIEHLLIADIIVFILFTLVYINNSYYHRKVKKFLIEYDKTNS